MSDNKNLSPTVCLLPVSSINIHATGKIVRCHMSEIPMGDVSEGSIIEQWNNEDFQQLRKDQREGVWQLGCQSCKTKEDNGGVSKRLHWQSLDVFSDLWDKVNWQAGKDNEIYHMDIAFNNLCNFKCRMCSSAYSNAWIGDENRLKEIGIGLAQLSRTSSLFDREKHSIKSSQLQEVIDAAPKLRRVEILGGEPFLVPEFMEFLSMLRTAGIDKNIELMITTNGSVVKPEHLEALEGFKYVNINLSLDATGSLFSYMRSAGFIDWDGIVKQAEMLRNWCDKPREGNYKLNINGTYQLVNSLNVKEFIEFIIKFYGWDVTEPTSASKNRHSFEHRILQGPPMYRAKHLPPDILEKSLAQIDELFATYPFLDTITERRYLNDIKILIQKSLEAYQGKTDYDRFNKEFIEYTVELDEIRNEKLIDCAPAIWEAYKQQFLKYEHKRSFKETNFCYMPWHGLAVAANGAIKPCCQWRDSIGDIDTVDVIDAWKYDKKIIELRQQFLDNERPESCNSCWEREDQIGESRRLWFADKFVTRKLEKKHEYTTKLKDKHLKWIQMDINLSNVCNLKCRMCGSWASNQWFEEEEALAKMSPVFEKTKDPEQLKIRQHSIEDLAKLIPYMGDTRRLDFKGGEPMLAKNHVEFLELLIEQNLHQNIVLQYTSNGTVVNPKILDTLSKFKEVRMMFSIEGTGSLYSYIRGGKYTIEQLEEVIGLYDMLPNIHIGFNVTVQAYNLLNLFDLQKQLRAWSYKFNNVKDASAFTTICNKPMYLSPFVMPEKLRKQVSKQLLGQGEFLTLIKKLDDRNTHRKHWETFKSFTNELDKMRGDNVLDHIPELKDYWND
jgi:radical SAM protein with 4Fe4S-binding SPASM domain